MHACDVLVVGGGPAGSSCARELVRRGLDVTVVDRAVFPRDKVCAGWITPQVVDELGLDVDDYASGRTFQRITGFETGIIGGRQVSTHYGRPVSFGIRRSEFDWYLLERSGAVLRTGEAIGSIRREGGAWVLNGRYRAPLLVGAGGHFCPVARSVAGSRDRTVSVVAAQEIEFALEPNGDDCSISPESPELYFTPDLRGYGWCFRKQGYLNVGLGRLGGGRMAERVRQFVEYLTAAGRVPASMPRRWHGHAYLLYGAATRPLVRDGILLAGDAAGLAYPQSGEGIRTAIESGVLAARAILDSPGAGDAALLHAYEGALHARFGKPAAGSAFASLVPAGALERLAARLLETRWFSRRVLLDRWFLHAAQPAL